MVRKRKHREILATLFVLISLLGAFVWYRHRVAEQQERNDDLLVMAGGVFPERVQELLEQGADVNCKSESSADRLSVADRLVNALWAMLGVRRAGPTDMQHATPLGIATLSAYEARLTDSLNSLEKTLPKHIAIVRLLLDRGADPNQPYENDTPLTLAIRYDAPEIVELLLAYGAKVDDAARKEAQGRPAILRLLIQAGKKG